MRSTVALIPSLLRLKSIIRYFCFVSATDMSSSDSALVITATGLGLFLQERSVRIATIQVRISDLNDESSSR